MSTNASNVICRYCKKEGHFKQQCPKLANKNNNTSQRRHETHARVLYKNHNQPHKQLIPSAQNEPVIITEPKVDEFPALGSSTQSNSTNSTWGGKSFIDVLKTEKEQEVKEDPDELKLETLGKIR